MAFLNTFVYVREYKNRFAAEPEDSNGWLSLKTMKAATTATALPGIHPNQVIEKIYESFSTDTGGKLHTVVWIGSTDRAHPVDISSRKVLLRRLYSLPELVNPCGERARKSYREDLGESARLK